MTEAGWRSTRPALKSGVEPFSVDFESGIDACPHLASPPRAHMKAAGFAGSWSRWLWPWLRMRMAITPKTTDDVAGSAVSAIDGFGAAPVSPAGGSAMTMSLPVGHQHDVDLTTDGVLRRPRKISPPTLISVRLRHSGFEISRTALRMERNLLVEKPLPLCQHVGCPQSKYNAFFDEELPV